VVNRYVFVLDQLVNMVNADTVISYDVFHRNISPQYIQLFDHFQVEVENYDNGFYFSVKLEFAFGDLRLILGWFTCNITNTILPFHISTMCYFDFKT
jgi:hypothetical protein